MRFQPQPRSQDPFPSLGAGREKAPEPFPTLPLGQGKGSGNEVGSNPCPQQNRCSGLPNEQFSQLVADYVASSQDTRRCRVSGW